MKKIQKHLTKHLRGVLAVALAAAVVVSVAAVTSSQDLHAEFPVYAAEGDESTPSVSEPTEPQNTEPQSTDTQNTGTQTTEPQNTEPQNTESTTTPASSPQSSADLVQRTLDASAAAPLTTQSGSYTLGTLPGYNSETGKIDVKYQYTKADSSIGTVTVPKEYKESYLTEGYSFDLDLPADYAFNKIAEENGKVFFDWTYNAKKYYEGGKVTVTDETWNTIKLTPEFSTFSTKAGDDHLPGYDEANRILNLTWQYNDGVALQSVLDPFPIDDDADGEELLIDYLTYGYFIPIYQMPNIFDQYKNTKYPSSGDVEAFRDKYFIGWSSKLNASSINDVITSFNLKNDNNGSVVLYPVFAENKYGKAEYQAVFLDQSRNNLYQVDGSIVYDGAADKYTFYDINENVITDVNAPAASSTIPDSMKWNTETDGSGYACKVGQSIKDYLLSLYKKYPDNNAVYVLFFAQNGTTSTTKTTGTSDTGNKVTVESLDSTSIPAFVEKISKYDSSFNKNTKNISFYEITAPSGSSGKQSAVIPYPNKTVAKNYKDYSYQLYHWKDDGSLERITPLTPTEDGVAFESDSFSPFALTWQAKSAGGASSPNTGDDFNALPIVIIALIAAMTAAAVPVASKKKEAAE